MNHAQPTQLIRAGEVTLALCPGCREPIVGEVTVRVEVSVESNEVAKRGVLPVQIAAHVVSTGLRVDHDCRPKQKRGEESKPEPLGDSYTPAACSCSYCLAHRARLAAREVPHEYVSVGPSKRDCSVCGMEKDFAAHIERRSAVIARPKLNLDRDFSGKLAAHRPLDVSKLP